MGEGNHVLECICHAFCDIPQKLVNKIKLVVTRQAHIERKCASHHKSCTIGDFSQDETRIILGQKKRCKRSH
jgi:hypothetical protein